MYCLSEKIQVGFDFFGAVVYNVQVFREGHFAQPIRFDKT